MEPSLKYMGFYGYNLRRIKFEEKDNTIYICNNWNFNSLHAFKNSVYRNIVKTSYHI